MIEQFFRELHPPARICYPAVKLAIDKIRAAAEEQTHRRGHDEIIAEVQPGNVMSARVIEREQQSEEHTAVARHAAFPNLQDRERLPPPLLRLGKKVNETGPHR